MSDAPDTDASPESAPIAEWLVDGFNVLHAGLLRGRDRKDWWNEERRRLVIERAGRLAAGGERVCVVFDGARPALADSDTPAGEGSAGVRVVFARDADEWILKAMRAAPDPSAVAIVTADRSVADRARRRGAQVIAPRVFLARCAEQAAAGGADPS
jgi:predicted RNA-binding protein with PIN domain